MAGVVLALFSILLLLSNFIDLRLGFVQLVIAFVCISFLSGYAILNVFNITKYFSKVETIILSFIFSFIFSGFSSLFVIFIDEHTRGIILSSIFFLTGVSLIIKQLKKKEKRYSTKPNSLSRKIDIFAIILSISFYCFFFYLIYPNATLLPDLDISRHYSYSAILSKSPDLYTGFNYLLFHSYSATLYVLSGLNQKIIYVQTLPVLLNLLLPLSIYVLAKRYFEGIDKRIPSLAIIFYLFLAIFHLYIIPI